MYLASHENEITSSGRKRKRNEFADHPHEQSNGEIQPRRTNSRVLMPPPLRSFKPPPQPTTPVPDYASGQPIQRPVSSRQPIRVYEDNAWRATQAAMSHEQQGNGEPMAYGHSGLQPQRELPFRPSASSNTQKCGFMDPHPQYEVHSRPNESYATHQMSSAQPALPYQQPSYQPLQTQVRSPYAQPQEYFADREGHGMQRERDSVTEGYDSHYRPKVPHQAERARLPLQPLPESYQNRQPFVRPQACDSHTTPSPRRSAEHQAASVISPFFRQDSAAQRAPTSQRPFIGGDPIRRQYANPTQQTSHDQRLAQGMADGRQSHAEPRSLNGLSFIDRPHRSDDHQPLYQSPSFRPDSNAAYQRPSVVPQTPRTTQGLFQRSDRPLPQASCGPNRAQSNRRPGRVSLPANAGPSIPLASNQDEALSQIRGVRGVSSYGKQHAPRGLYSSAGGQRSVYR